MNTRTENQEEEPAGHSFTFGNTAIGGISETDIFQHLYGGMWYDSRVYQYIVPKRLELNEGVFTSQSDLNAFPDVVVLGREQGVQLFCNCSSAEGKLCEHQAVTLTAILKREELRVFFDQSLRHEKLRKFAEDYGLQDEADPDSFFRIEYQNKKLLIKPLSASLFPVTKESMKAWTGLLEDDNNKVPSHPDPDLVEFVVLRQHKYYNGLIIGLYQGAATAEGNIKNPVQQLSPMDKIWGAEDQDEIKFFTGLNKFQNHTEADRSEQDLAALRAIVKNPRNYRFYYHDKQVSENITARSVVPVVVSKLSNDLTLNVSNKDCFYELTGSLEIEGDTLQVNDLTMRFGWFLLYNGRLFLVDNLQTIALIELLKKRNGSLLIHASKYRDFRNNLLIRLEDKTTIKYSHIQPATPAQLLEQGFNRENEKIIFLSDFGQHVMIIPVIRYGEVEIPVRTKKPIYGEDEKGKEFLVPRNAGEEVAFISLLTRQHPYFEEQMENDLYYFYLHKRFFLDEDWFLKVFEEWRQQGITILGFNEIENNRLNPHKVKISIKVLSGINWFNVLVNARFGQKKARMKQIFKAVRNKSKYVQLDDGTLGILPAEWIEKFSEYFNAAQVVDDEMLGIAKVNFSVINELFDAEMLEENVKEEVGQLRNKFSGFNRIRDVNVSPDFKGTLREYQKHGLNWLNFLDELGFGGCLADDMGLGKTVQVIAFILLQREKKVMNTNLVVVPASLIFNWQQEVSRFAPSLKVHTIYGSERIRSSSDFDQHELILTSYGTLLSDIRFLKDYEFNYIFLDESQNIKNPESQRYKAVSLLKARNRIAITGTPMENNTFDLYGQLSFACPGLLGSKRYFKDIYLSPVDKFKNSKRARELQRRIMPFILRRTKQQVAPELPEKTEMVLWCEMNSAQRAMYDAFEKEFRDFISATTNEEIKQSPMYVLKGLTKLRQICDSPLLLKGEKLKGDESAKIVTLMEQIETKAPQHKILVFSQFVSMLELVEKELERRGIGFVKLTGSTRNREAVVTAFQEEPDKRVFLISLKAGGTGLNLTEADYVYLLEPWWNPAVENQAIDRSHRIGQNKKVVAVRLLCPGTVEEKMMKLQEVKRELTSDLIKAESSFFKTLSRDDLLALLS